MNIVCKPEQYNIKVICFMLENVENIYLLESLT